MATSTSLGLRALFKAAISKSGLDRATTLVSGLTPTAKALYVAAVAHGAPRAVVLTVVPADRDIEPFVSDVRFLLAELEGLSGEAATRAVAPFPSHEVDPYRGMAPHGGVLSARALALHGALTGTVRVIVASAAALLPRISPPGRLRRASVDLAVGQDIAPDRLCDVLVDAGFRREDPADEPGEFAVRGGILDVFPPHADRPVRVEFVGDSIESLRAYEPETQRSIGALDQLHIVPLRETFPEASDPARDDRTGSLFDYLAAAPAFRLVVAELDEVEHAASKVLTQLAESYEQQGAGAREPSSRRRDTLPPPDQLSLSWPEVAEHLQQATRIEQLTLGDAEAPLQGGTPAGAHVRSQPVAELHGRVGDWVAEIRRLREAGETVLFVAATPGRAERTVEILKEYEIFAVRAELANDARYASVMVAVGGLARGVRLPDAALTIFAEGDVFEEERHGHERRPSATRAFLSDLRDLKVGDFVVHVDHGIGAFVGLKQLGVGESSQEFLELRYAGDDKLFVPVERLDLVQKYTGASRPPLDRLGGTTWERAKTKVKKAMRDMAEELLKLYAARKAVPGHAFSPDSHWQEEFEDAFEWELTPDQRTAVADIKRDMESTTPMDRLLCGDVGYGKTEVAMRAAFKAVMDGKQVAFLAPTTVLAFQHQKTLKERFAGFPVRIDMVSRFRSKAEQTAALADLEAGKLDIIVGTHRLLSKDVRFRDLGLLVVDEEQRFGVAHKERLKQLRKKVDVLTMSATPIPRTLNMSLVGVRDMSIIETPPKDRLSIQTNVVKFDQQVIQRAIRTELDRGGQVFFVHNRVESIFSIGALIQRLVPEARVVVGHGQMGEDELERAMLRFVAREFDVLLATTIIENGLDIPNANTIIINRADRYGLSQLYQLRGRVGRSDRPAYAYLLIPPEESLSQVAKKRLAAIKEFSDLGSGFRVAALDLEIRGAGNLLGGEQSGHMDTVGFEMYLKLLEETVRELKGEDIEDDVRANVNLRVDFRIDDAYVPDMNQRLMLYRKIAAARAVDEIERILEETVDRYGPLPDSVRNLADYGRIRVMADRLGIDSIDRDGKIVVIKFGARAAIDPVRFLSLVQQRPELTMVPPSAVKLDLGGGRPAPAPPPPPMAPGPAGRQVKRKGGKESATAPSWWTARARTGAVTPGFNRDAVLRSAPIDPRAEGGVFDRVGGLLSDLLDQM